MTDADCRPRKSKKWTSRDLRYHVCRVVLLEFRKVLKEAKHRHWKKSDLPFPPELKVSFNGETVYVSTGSFKGSSVRQVLVRSDEDALTWLNSGFDQVVQQQLGPSMCTAGAAGQFVRCGYDKVAAYTGIVRGVRDKVVWRPDKKMWHIEFTGDSSLEECCGAHQLNLRVNRNLQGAEFRKECDERLIDACKAWNVLDNSKARRIKLPATGETCPHIKVIKQADTQCFGDLTESDNDSGKSDAESINSGHSPT